MNLSSQPATRRTRVVTGAVLAVWLALVVFTTAHHEFWRDEVRAWSLARAAGTPFDLYHLIQYDGHPVLWYVLLFTGTSIVDSPLVLPIASILVAFAAAALFMFAAPFPLWLRTVVIFTALAAFEYSVMARNYGISMLLMFLAAVLYRTRATHPYRLAAALALLANTNVHSTMFAGLVAGAWGLEIAAGQWKGRIAPDVSRYLPLGVVLAGAIVALAFAMPRQSTTLAPGHQRLATGDVLQAVRGAVIRPDETFPDLIPGWVRPKVAILLLYGAIVGLFLRPPLLLAALGAQLALGMFFRLIYPGWYRHQGLYLMFLLFLYWILIESAGTQALRRIPRLVFRGGLYGALLSLLALDVMRAPGVIRADIAEARSASRAFGAFLTASAQYRDAVIVAEPDFMMESLPFYASNPIYLPRERRFSPTVSWTTASQAHLTLGDVLAAAREVGAGGARPVLIVLPPLDLSDEGEQRYMYGKVFTWNAEEAEAFQAATTPVGKFTASQGDEDYVVYALARPASGSSFVQ